MRTKPSLYIMPIPVYFVAEQQISEIRLVLALQVNNVGQATVILMQHNQLIQVRLCCSLQCLA